MCSLLKSVLEQFLQPTYRPCGPPSPAKPHPPFPASIKNCIPSPPNSCLVRWMCGLNGETAVQRLPSSSHVHFSLCLCVCKGLCKIMCLHARHTTMTLSACPTPPLCVCKRQHLCMCVQECAHTLICMCARESLITICTVLNKYCLLFILNLPPFTFIK